VADILSRRDVEAVMSRAIAHGAKVLQPIHNTHRVEDASVGQNCGLGFLAYSDRKARGKRRREKGERERRVILISPLHHTLSSLPSSQREFPLRTPLIQHVYWY